MKTITVYADFDFLASPLEIGTLGYEHVRSNDHFVFEYSRSWLKQYGGIILSGDLMNIPSLQHPRGNDNVFGFVKDSFPDRWVLFVAFKGGDGAVSSLIGFYLPSFVYTCVVALPLNLLIVPLRKRLNKS